MLAAMLDEPSWDIAKAASAFPMAFTGELMGLPESDWPMLSRLAVAAVAPDDPDYHRSSRRGAAAAANHQLFSYLAGQVRDKAAREDDDLIGFLTRVDAGGRRLRHDEIVYNCYSLLLGGNLTTPHVATGTILALADNPGELGRLAADPTLITTGVEEGLRWVSPARHFMRHVVADTEVAGVRLSAGDAIVAWVGSANRDESVFADPYRFDVGRSPNRHVAFGFGVHYCLGAPLARIALRVFLEEFVSAVAEVELAGPVQHLHSNFLAAFKSAPVAARLRPSAIPVLQEAIAADGPLTLLDANARSSLRPSEATCQLLRNARGCCCAALATKCPRGCSAFPIRASAPRCSASGRPRSAAPSCASSSCPGGRTGYASRTTRHTSSSPSKSPRNCRPTSTGPSDSSVTPVAHMPPSPQRCTWPATGRPLRPALSSRPRWRRMTGRMAGTWA
jgi:hypothetical protein